jgi:hypothetical protein
VDAASRPKLTEIGIVLGGLVAIGASGMLWGLSSRETSEGRATKEEQRPFYFWRSATAVTLGAICLLVGPWLIDRVAPTTHNTIVRLHHDALNARDLAMQRRGYYEELDVGRENTSQWGKALGPEAWGEGKKVFYRQRSDFLLKEIVPSVSSVIAGAPVTSNSMGMRDREYDKVKPVGTYRIVLLGASHDMGSGVKNDQTYENLVEDHLNRERPDARYLRYEIMNMAVPGDCILQMLLRLEQTGFDFQPDAVIFSVAAVDQQFIVEHLRKCLTLGIEVPPGYREFLDGIIHKAGVDGRMRDAVIERRLLPYVSEVHEWVFRRLVQQCAQRGIQPLVIYRPAPIDFEGVEAARRSEIVRLARAAGLEVIDLSPAFDSVVDRNSLIVAKWDDHTTALGHRLLADKLYTGLVPLLFGSINQPNAVPQP